MAQVYDQLLGKLMTGIPTILGRSFVDHHHQSEVLWEVGRLTIRVS